MDSGGCAVGLVFPTSMTEMIRARKISMLCLFVRSDSGTQKRNTRHPKHGLALMKHPFTTLLIRRTKLTSDKV